VRYWDTSALVTLLAAEAATPAMEALLEADPVVITWWGTRVECASALARLERDGHLTAAGATAASAALADLRDTWHEVLPTELVREHAERMVRLHPLRAADGLQLAAALVASEFRPGTLPFVALDERLAHAARREGFPGAR
jgi:predicted nucleic acid-binding protein